MVQNKVSISSSNGANNTQIAIQVKPRVIQIPQQLLQDIARAIANIRGWGSVEIFIQDHKVTQITERNIKKTDAKLVVED